MDLSKQSYPDHDAARKGERNQQSWQNLNIRS